MSDAILELKDLKKSYNQNKSNQIDVLLGANLLLKKGEVVALLQGRENPHYCISQGFWIKPIRGMCWWLGKI